MEHFEIMIIGGGAGGMAAALSAFEKGYRKILLVERRSALGGVLLQCTHNGFGLGFFKEDLKGTEYAKRFQKRIETSKIQVLLDTMALKLYPDRTALLSGKEGLRKISFDLCVLASGCRERTLYSTDACGTRPAGIMTAGTAQKLINLEGLNIGDEIVILGTGDVGQIMAGQLAQQGKHIIAMIEKEDHPGGLKRNQEKYLKAYDIPLMLNSVITKIKGQKRIEGVCVQNLISGNESYMKCSTLLTAIGMIPETDLLRQSFKDGEIPDWIRKVGNCEYVHDIVDSVTADGYQLWNDMKNR